MTRLLVCLMLAGCSLSVDQEEIEKATALCVPHGGLKWIWTTSQTAKCNNGVNINYQWVKKP